MTAQRYRKLPVTIEAMQWTGNNINDLWDWVGAGALYGPVPAEGGKPATPARLWVAANAAWLDLDVTEWIAKDRHGFYPIKADVFAVTYEAVTS